MPVFEYRATDSQGRPVNGTLVGASLTAAATDLAQRGFDVQHLGLSAGVGDPIPQDFQPATTPQKGYPYATSSAQTANPQDMQDRSAFTSQVVAPLIGKISLHQLLFFFRQLASLLHAGVNLVQALDTLSGHSMDPRFRHVVRELRDHAQAGHPMSMGMARYPEVFSPLMLALMRAGEQGGIMEHTARQIAEYVEREIELRNLIRRVTFYPKFVIGFSMLLILGVNGYISSLGKKGPLWSPLTDITTWIWLGPLLVALFLFVRVGLHNPQVKYYWDSFLISVPMLGNTLKQLAMAKFGRAFGALYRGGVAPTTAIVLAADSCGNEALRQRIKPAAHSIQQGAGITDSFARTGAFSQIVLDMTRTGETTGNLDQMLEQVSTYYEEEANTRTHQFGYVFGVIVLLCVAAYVLVVILNFYSNYYGGMMSAGDIE